MAIGIALESVGKLTEAVAAYQKALKINPEHPETHNSLVIALSAQGKLQDTVHHFSE
jgi:Flp pilus assembly protein TadD